MEALTLPQTKQVDGTIPRVGLRSSPGVDLALDVPKKAALQGCLAKSGLCLPGWTSPCLEKSRTYLAEIGVAGPPRCPALWALAQFHAWACEAAQVASISAWTSRKRLQGWLAKSALCLPGSTSNLALTWLKLVWLDLPAAWGRPCGGTATKSRWRNSKCNKP